VERGKSNLVGDAGQPLGRLISRIAAPKNGGGKKRGGKYCTRFQILGESIRAAVVFQEVEKVRDISPSFEKS